MRHGNAARTRPRRGTAIVAALGMLMLGAALLAGGAAASVELERSTRAALGRARTEWESRRALGVLLQGWDAGADSLPIGAARDLTLPTSVDVGPALSTAARIRRYTTSLFSVTVVVRVGDPDRRIARRELRLLLERNAVGGDTTSATEPRPAPEVRVPSRWSVGEVR